MRVTVCELPAATERLDQAWEALAAHIETEGSDLLLLPEMPFAPWLAATKEVDPPRWEEATRAHDRWQGRFEDLGVGTVLGSKPVVVDGRRLNEGFVWEEGGYRPAHYKYYLPDEDGFWEATWYQRGDGSFDPAQTVHGGAGLLICSEVWFGQHARAYGQQGVTLVANPRATEWSSRDKWLAAGRVAAVVSGAFCLSSNRSGSDETGIRWGGLGWVVDPDGAVMATTSEESPFATVELDPLHAERAKHTYPRYVED